jgi:hypothetical protein
VKNLESITYFLEFQDEINADLRKHNVSLIKDEALISQYYKALDNSPFIVTNFTNMFKCKIIIWSKLTWEQFCELDSNFKIECRSMDFKTYSAPQSIYAFNYYQKQNMVFYLKLSSTYCLSTVIRFLDKFKKLNKKFNLNFSVESYYEFDYDKFDIIGFGENKKSLHPIIICAEKCDNCINIKYIKTYKINKNVFSCFTETTLKAKKKRIENFFKGINNEK